MTSEPQTTTPPAATSASLSTRIRRKITWLRAPLATLAGFWLLSMIRHPGPFWAGAVIAIAGEALQLWATSHLHKDTRFTISGPYSHLRNPMYAGRFFLLLGFFVMTGNAWLIAGFVVAFALYAQSRVGREEARLRRIFAPHYDHYRSEVHRWLPSLKPYSRSENRRASWKQVVVNGEQSIAVGTIVVLMLAGLSAGVVFPALAHFSLMGPDEPRYAEVGREMWASGDYVSTRLCGLLWFEKPALTYWLMAVCYHVFGLNELSARLPSLLGSLATVLFLCHALRQVVTARVSWICGLVLATSALWIGYAFAATTDMVLACTVSLAVLSGYLASVTGFQQNLSEEERLYQGLYEVPKGSSRLEYGLTCAACVGLSMLAKGLIGPLLIVLILGLHGLWTRRWVFTRGREFLMGCVVFGLVAALWYVPVTLRYGRIFIDEFFINHHFKRYLTNEFHHRQPPYYYLPIVLGGALPWTAFLLPALVRLRFLRPRETRLDSLLALAWLWILVPVLFFSGSEAKLAGYILPIFPALAIVLGLEVERVWSGARTKPHGFAMGASALVPVLVGVGLVGYLERKGLAPTGAAALSPFLPALVGLGMGAAYWRSRKNAAAGRVEAADGVERVDSAGRAAVYGPALAQLCLIVVAGSVFLPQLSKTKSLKPLSLQVASSLKPGEQIAFYKKQRSYAPVFYAEGRVAFYEKNRPLQRDTNDLARGDELDLTTPAALVSALERPPHLSLIVITSAQAARELEIDPRFQTQRVANQGDVAALRVLRRSPSA